VPLPYSCYFSSACARIQSCSINWSARVRTRSSESFKASMSGSTDPFRPCCTQRSSAWRRTWASGEFSAVAIQSGTTSFCSGGGGSKGVDALGTTAAGDVGVTLRWSFTGPLVVAVGMPGSPDAPGPQPTTPTSHQTARSTMPRVTLPSHLVVNGMMDRDAECGRLKADRMISR
jgi:hypothetical protein